MRGIKRHRTKFSANMSWCHLHTAKLNWTNCDAAHNRLFSGEQWDAVRIAAAFVVVLCKILQYILKKVFLEQ